LVNHDGHHPDLTYPPIRAFIVSAVSHRRLTITYLTAYNDTAPGWQKVLYAFLAEKERRSGSRRTVDAYAGMLAHFFGSLGKEPGQVTSPEVFSFAHSVGLSGKEPSSTTIGARIACVSSFYRFLIRMGIVAFNPCDALERPKSTVSTPRGLSPDQIRKLLGVIPNTPSGLRNRAIILMLVFTGRRRAEVIGLKAGDLQHDGDRVYYTYRGKGGKTGRRELPRPAYDAMVTALAVFSKHLATMSPQQSIWPSSIDPSRGITSGTFYGNLRKYLKAAGLPLSGVHIFRHSAAKLRRDAGESVEQVSQFLDHTPLAVTTTYLRRLEGVQDKGWRQVADAIGL
jgi:site-specific recombinase XerD